MPQAARPKRRRKKHHLTAEQEASVREAEAGWAAERAVRRAALARLTPAPEAVIEACVDIANAAMGEYAIEHDSSGNPNHWFALSMVAGTKAAIDAAYAAGLRDAAELRKNESPQG